MANGEDRVAQRARSRRELDRVGYTRLADLHDIADIEAYLVGRRSRYVQRLEEIADSHDPHLALTAIRTLVLESRKVSESRDPLYRAPYRVRAARAEAELAGGASDHSLLPESTARTSLVSPLPASLPDLRTLPAEVLERLAAGDELTVSLARMQTTVRRRRRTRQPATAVEPTPSSSADTARPRAAHRR